MVEEGNREEKSAPALLSMTPAFAGQGCCCIRPSAVLGGCYTEWELPHSVSKSFYRIESHVSSHIFKKALSQLQRFILLLSRVLFNTQLISGKISPGLTCYE